MIKTIQNWLDVRKQYKLKKKLIEMRDDAKKIISGVMSELVKYDVNFKYEHYVGNDLSCNYHLEYGTYGSILNLAVYSNSIMVQTEERAIATYEIASLWQKMRHQRNLKSFIYAEDAIKAISNMIIMGEAI